MRREITTWSVVAALLVVAFGITVLVLNSSLYSAGGFVRSYLDALARHDASGALELIGDTAPGDGRVGASDALLIPDAMGDLSDIQFVSDSPGAGGVHTVEYSFTVDGVIGQSSFDVVSDGAVLGLFTSWEFATDPLAVVGMSALTGTSVTANGIELAPTGQNDAVPYLVFAPGVYAFSHDSPLLHAETVTVAAVQGGSTTPAPLEVVPTADFLASVQGQVDSYLDECATQQVLLPTGCPFGQEIGNRIVTAPQWSIAEYPAVALDPGPSIATWQVNLAQGTAHLLVDVRSLFDGSVSTFDEDVPFASTYVVSVLGTDDVVVSPVY